MKKRTDNIVKNSMKGGWNAAGNRVPFRLLLAGLLCCLLCVNVRAQSGMTDRQVLEYVKEGVKQGKEQKQLASELARRGVTREQAERVKKLYEQENSTNVSTMQGTDRNEARLREESADETSALAAEQPEAEELAGEERVFGRNIFNTRNLTFEPNENMPTPPNYRLGPGDELVIDVWGASQASLRLSVSPEGTVNVQELGPIYVSGLTVEEAGNLLRAELEKIYSNEKNQMRVTLGNTRTIRVNVMGEVAQPGTYSLSAFSTVFHALYRAGGVNGIGSLRDVQLVRDGKRIATVDVYEFILQGHVRGDISLQEGDVVIVPAYSLMVKMSGKVKRAMKFEMKEGETLSTLIRYAGGFEADAYRKTLRIVRQTGEEYEVKTVDEFDFSVCSLRDGDVVTVGTILDRFTNKVEVKGAVYRPDIYELDGEVNTVRALIGKAKGLMDDAFTNRAVLQRQKDDLTNEILPVDVKALLDGRIPDIPLRKNDILYIPSIHDLQDLGDVSIAGEVARPDSYPYAENMTLEDLIIRAGGLKEAASTVRVDISRRIKDPSSTNSTDSIGRLFSFSLKDGFVIDGRPGFVLQPYDQVLVRRSPGYRVQQNVRVHGEINFEGTYALTLKTERLSDLVEKAGGLTAFAYARGARLTRIANYEEKKRMQDVVTLLGRELGEAMMDSLGIRVEDTYTVGIDLEEALARPGSEADLVLREGDVLTVPEYVNTIRISGSVMVPNIVTYRKSEGIDYYLDQAGGYSQHAKKSRKFIIYMNGQVARVKGNGARQIEPGCEIVVPNKKKRNAANLSSILAYASSFASLGTMAASIANLVK